MSSLHNHIMSLVKAHQQENNNARQNTDGTGKKPNNVSPNKIGRFRMSTAGYSINLSPALLAQLDNYCENNKLAPKTKPDAQPQPMTRSKAIRRAVYELMEKPEMMHRTPSHLPTAILPPERTRSVAWTMPTKKPEHAQHMYNLCDLHGVKQYAFVRRAIYIYTKGYASKDKAEHEEAMRDAWS